MFKIIVLLISFCCTISAETHLFILSGQSNMARMDENAGFLPELKALLPNDTILHTKSASPGKPIRNWLEEWDSLAVSQKLTPEKIRQNDRIKGSPFYSKILKPTQELLKQNPDSVTFIWMQGESDSKSGASIVYESALKTLISKLRRDLKRPDMKVVIGRISDFGSSKRGKEWPGWQTVRQAQETVVAQDSQAALVNTDDLNGPRDGLHYPKEGYEKMGRLMAREAVKLIKK